VKGKDALQAYFKKGLEAYPNLKFDLLDIMWGLSSVVLYYVNQIHTLITLGVGVRAKALVLWGLRESRGGSDPRLGSLSVVSSVRRTTLNR
jgi:hypothetical protein